LFCDADALAQQPNVRLAHVQTGIAVIPSIPFDGKRHIGIVARFDKTAVDGVVVHVTEGWRDKSRELDKPSARITHARFNVGDFAVFDFPAKPTIRSEPTIDTRHDAGFIGVSTRSVKHASMLPKRIKHRLSERVSFGNGKRKEILRFIAQTYFDAIIPVVQFRD
jgi:hypothetical protein